MPYREPARRSTRYLRFCLDVLTTRSRCDVPWDLMDGDRCMRACPMCSRQVHDVSQMAAPDAEGFLAEHMGKPPKLRLYRRLDGRLMESECPTGARERRTRRIVSVLRGVHDPRAMQSEFWADIQGIRRVAAELESQLGFYGAWRQACGEWADTVMREPEPHTHPFDCDLTLPGAGGC